MSADHGHDDHPGYAGPPPSTPGPPAGQPWGAQPGAVQPGTAQPWGAQPGYGPPPAYGPGYAPAYGAQPGWWTPPAPPPPSWPNGPGRPQQAGAAATLAFIAGGIALMWGLVGIVLLAGSDGGSASWLGVAVGLPSGVALIAGGTRLLAGADRWVVVGGGAALALAVLAQAVVSAATSYGSAFGQAFLVVLLLPVPTIAAVLAGLPVVGGWVDHVRSGPSGGHPGTPPTW
ncbi:hypothetical protein SAMN03159343_3927 [Klenkia marina]|uniref:Uncharacterized protein n=1 Tax=Klenkia marina TaxID=1960309 RepID=A0A1G4Z109_9ACTN|nr:hypothetical protein [Klenkia marina]SCX59255.1 hypothetical protein SAMN03159343_3927 [Klenkia marina]